MNPAVQKLLTEQRRNDRIMKELQTARTRAVAVNNHEVIEMIDKEIAAMKGQNATTQPKAGEQKK